MKKSIRMYDMVFPLWALFTAPLILFPPILLISLGLNFLIDSLVFYIAAKILKLDNKFFVWRKSILKIWLLGFLSDIFGGELTFVIAYVIVKYDSSFAIPTFPATLIALPGVILAGLLIYFFGRKTYFSKTNLSDEQIKKLSLALAIFTAPYLMLIPTY